MFNKTIQAYDKAKDSSVNKEEPISHPIKKSYNLLMKTIYIV